MPTGYTDIIARKRGGLTLNQFTWRCARAFGALVDMRDMSLEAQVEMVKSPDSYHVKEMACAQDEMTALATMPDEILDAEAERRYRHQMDNRAESRRRTRRLKRRYQRLLEKVRNWQPPTDDHIGLKEFMVEQLTSSIECDCRVYREKIVRLTAAEFRARGIEMAQSSFNYHRERLHEELDRLKGRNQWLADLAQSVGFPEELVEDE